jgi:23S rRNA-/tRNA-specific pseudouridylate synthase
MKILYQNSSCLIVNKAPRIHSDEVMTHCVDPALRSWKPAHRLDFETSGCLLIAAPEHHAAYLACFKDTSSESTEKIYLVGAELDLHLPEAGLVVEGWIASRYRGSKSVRFLDDDAPERRKKWHSIRPVRHHVWKAQDEALEAAQLVGFRGVPYVVRLHTGARHQLRAAFKAWGAPLVNDPVYGHNVDSDVGDSMQAPTPADALLELHAWKLSLKDPLHGITISATANERGDA